VDVRALEVEIRDRGVLTPGSRDDDQLRIIEQSRNGGCEVAAIAAYYLITGSDDETEPAQVALAQAIEIAARADVPLVSTVAGFPIDDDRERTITEVLPDLLRPLLSRAGELGVRVAFENWYRTNLRDLDNCRLFFETFPDEHVGLVFDPSHLEWMGIDWRAGLDEFSSRVRFAHAKDVLIDRERLRRVGVLGTGWWRYVLPGRGVIPTEAYLRALRSAGYDGAISIEHEDREFGPAEGIAAAAAEVHRAIATIA
jgi:sugar phosphate isomerase/epimerase